MKKKNLFLSACVSLALYSDLSAQEELPDPDLETVVIVGEPLDPIPIPVSAFPGIPENFWWSESPQSGSGGGDGTVTPGDWSDTPNSPYCALMAQQGFPEGCTRQFIQSGPPVVDEIQNPWGMDQLVSSAYNGGVLNIYFGYSLLALRTCYSDIGNDPGFCEDSYRQSIRSTCNMFSYTFPTARNDMSDRQLCNQAADEIDARMGIAASNRIGAPWFDWFRDLDLGIVRSFYVAWDRIAPSLLDQYNGLLVQAREYRGCEILIRTWDEQGCGINLPS